MPAIFNLNLAVFEAAIDWGYKDEEAKQPEQVPYFCELTAVWVSDSYTGNYVSASTHGFIYPVVENGVFARWDLKRFEVDYIRNSDTYDYARTQDNNQGFEFDCLTAYENYEDISQTAADRLEEIAKNLGDNIVNVEYPNGFVELIGATR